ncbi:MAG: hypothetical protein ACKOET_02585 [Verrucomicrobiota bacterium]
MKRILQVLTRPDDALSAEWRARVAEVPETVVEVADLTGEAPDYAALVERILAADAVISW